MIDAKDLETTSSSLVLAFAPSTNSPKSCDAEIVDEIAIKQTFYLDSAR